MPRLLFAVVLVLGTCGDAFAASLPAGAPLTRDLVADLLHRALRQQAPEQPLQLTIAQPALPMANQAAAATEIVVEAVDYDATHGRFTAVLVGTVDGRPRFRLRTHGRALALVELPVLPRALAPGERVGAADLDWLTVRPNQLRPTSLTTAEQLIGTEARRSLSPGRILTARDLGPPRLVRRGRPVQVVYARPGLQLSAFGMAQDDGTLGEAVRVINPDNRRQLQGVVTGPDEITIQGASLALAAR